MAANLVKLISKDGKIVEVDVAAAMESKMVKTIIEAEGIDKPIRLSHVSGAILTKVMEFCNHQVKSRKTSEEKRAALEDEIKNENKAWDEDFVKVERHILFYLTTAADELEIKNLVNLTCQTLLHRINDETSPAAKRYFLNMVNKHQVRLIGVGED